MLQRKAKQLIDSWMQSNNKTALLVDGARQVGKTYLTRAASLELLAGKTGVNKGSLYENAVAQELAAHGFSLFYLNSKKHGELDFVVQNDDDRVFPIEVKSGKDYKRHRALANVLDCKQYHLDCGYVFGPGNIERDGKILYAPVYTAGFLEAR